MNVYGTPIPCIPLDVAAVAASTTEAALLASMAGNGKYPVIVSNVKLGVTAAALDEVSESASDGLTVYGHLAIGHEGKDANAWRTIGYGRALSITGTPEDEGTEEEAYAGFTVSASGGVEPYAFSLVGDWPEGITVDASTGVVSGTFATDSDDEYADLSVRVTDAGNSTQDLATFTLTVAAAE